MCTLYAPGPCMCAYCTPQDLVCVHTVCPRTLYVCIMCAHCMPQDLIFVHTVCPRTLYVCTLYAPGPCICAYCTPRTLFMCILYTPGPCICAIVFVHTVPQDVVFVHTVPQDVVFVHTVCPRTFNGPCLCAYCLPLEYVPFWPTHCCCSALQHV